MSRKRNRRRKAGAAARLRPFWFLIAILVALTAFGGYWLATWPALDPHAVDVSGNRVVSKDAILTAARIDVKRNLWLQNVRSIERRIVAIPYIDTARVHRTLPASVRIDVTERTPFAVVATASSRLVIDRQLRVLQQATPQFALLPLVEAHDLQVAAHPGSFLSEPHVVAMTADLARLQEAHVDVTQVSQDRFGDLDVVLRDGVRVMLGDRLDLGKKIALIDPILQQVGRSRRPIAAIDLRALRTPVVVYKK